MDVQPTRSTTREGDLSADGSSVLTVDQATDEPLVHHRVDGAAEVASAAAKARAVTAA